MISNLAISSDASRRAGQASAANPSLWWCALAVALLLMGCLDWLLVRLIWLPFYCGLFGFLVAGLIVGGVSFRLARPARPLTRRRVLLGVFLVALLSTLIAVVWEYRFVSATIGAPPKFADLKNRAVRAGRSPSRITRLAAADFRRRLAEAHAPGGPLGYARWAMSGGEMEVEVEGVAEGVSIDHQGAAWLIRTLIACLLTALGLWLSFESLRSPRPVTNTLAPGEAYEEIE